MAKKEYTPETGFKEAERRISRWKFGQSLNLMELNLTEIPTTIKHLTSLLVLKLNNNSLSHFPEFITRLSSLEELNLCNNNISHLPDTISNLMNLHKLNLDFNPLVQLPKSLGSIRALETGAMENQSNGLIIFNTPLIRKHPFEKLIINYPQPIPTINVLKYLRGDFDNLPYVEEELEEEKPLSQDTSTTTFAFNSKGQFDLAPPSPEDQLDDTPEQRDRYQDLQELAVDLADLSSQQLGAIYTHTKGFHTEISKDFLNCNVKTLWKYGNRLRVRLEAHTANQDEFSDAKLNPEAAARAQILISEYNVFRTYDSKLSKEDIKSFSPSELADYQAKQKLIKPFIDQALKGDNFTDPAKEQVEEANEPLKSEPKAVNQQQELANKHGIIGNVIISAFSKIQAGLKITEKPPEHHLKATTLEGAYVALGGGIATGIGLGSLMLFGIRAEIIELIITQRDLIAVYLSHTLPHTTTMNMITKLQLLWEEAKGKRI